MRIGSLVAWLLVFVGWSAASGQEVKYVACDSSNTIQHAQLCSKDWKSAKTAKVVGTLNPKAIVVDFEDSVVKAALDSAKADAERLDLLRLDLAGIGEFDNKSVIPLVTTLDQDQIVECLIGPKTLEVKLRDKTIPVTVVGGTDGLDASHPRCGCSCHMRPRERVDSGRRPTRSACLTGRAI